MANCNPAVSAIRAVALPASARDIQVVCEIENDHEFDLVALGACLIDGYVIDTPAFRFACWVQDDVSYLVTNVPSFTAPA